jgi:heme oxygenase
LLDTTPGDHPVSPATAAYMRAIATAAEREASSCSAGSRDAATPSLLAHFYARYLADLFGGSMLGWPTRRALGFKQTPQFYTHDVFDSGKPGVVRKQYVERVYEAINDAGEDIGANATAETVEEARRAFAANAAVFAEGSGSSLLAATVGGVRVMGGYAAERVWGAREQRDLFGRLVKRRDPKTGSFSSGGD